MNSVLGFGVLTVGVAAMQDWELPYLDDTEFASFLVDNME